MSRAEVSADPTVQPLTFLNRVVLNRKRNTELVEIPNTGNLVSCVKLFLKKERAASTETAPNYVDLFSSRSCS